MEFTAILFFGLFIFVLYATLSFGWFAIKQMLMHPGKDFFFCFIGGFLFWGISWFFGFTRPVLQQQRLETLQMMDGTAYFVHSGKGGGRLDVRFSNGTSYSIPTLRFILFGISRPSIDLEVEKLSGCHVQIWYQKHNSGAFVYQVIANEETVCPLQEANENIAEYNLWQPTIRNFLIIALWIEAYTAIYLYPKYKGNTSD